MSTFGQFLVAQGVVSVAQLVDALLWQRQERTPMEQLALDQRVLGPERVLAVLDREAVRKVDFEKAVLDMGLLEPAALDELRIAHLESGPHIGQVLVAMGAAGEDDLDRALEDYNARAESESNR